MSGLSLRARMLDGGVRANHGKGHQLAEEPSLTTRIETERLEPLVGEINEIRIAQLDMAAMALEHRKIPTAYDAVWRALHQVRHIDCEHAARSKLLRIAGDLAADLKYNEDAVQLRERLETIKTELVAGEPTTSMRMDLLRMSTTVAEERESRWRQTNRVIMRRRHASSVVRGFGLLLAGALPLATMGWSGWSVYLLGVFRYLTLGCCGALGGLLSGLLNKDRAGAPSIEHHLEQLRFRLRPSIGFVAAIIASLVAGATGMMGPEGLAGGLQADLLLLALASGFSERVLLGHMKTGVPATSRDK